MKALSLLLLAAIVACSVRERPPKVPAPFSEVYEVWIDSRFTKDDRQGIEVALQRWNVALNGYARFDVFPEYEENPEHDSHARLEQIWADHPVTVQRVWDSDAIPKFLLAWVDVIGGAHVHLIPERMDAADWGSEPITLHELGHVLGLEDDTHHLHTLMATPVTAMTTCIDERTTSEIATYHGWEATRMIPECQ